MSLLSLKAHILVGALLWTVGLFALTGVVLHAVTSDDFSTHVAMHASGEAVSGVEALRHGPFQTSFRWLFFVHGPMTAVVGGLAMLFGFLEIRRGLSPITEVRDRLAAVHQGVDARVGGRYPSEVQPLVDEINALLEERERRVARALASTGDLAHGLKTPLAVLAHEAQQVRAAGVEAPAATIDQQVDRMRRQIDVHLAHARSGAGSASLAARASIAASAEGLVRTLQRLHADRGLRFAIEVPGAHTFRGQREDLDEMLGNLLDNACKWARTTVTLTSSKEGDGVVIMVDDDGPGIEASMRDAVLQRGIRADEAAPGSGLGLAIVRDLVEIYGGSILLETSPMEGTRARLKLPT